MVWAKFLVVSRLVKLNLSVWFYNQVYTGSFSLGMGGIPWVIMSEVDFPYHTWNTILLLSKNCHEGLWLAEIELILSQIFPINMKGSAGSLVTLVSWLGSWIVSYAFNFLMDWSSAGDAKLVLSLNIDVILDANYNMITLVFNLCLPFSRNILHILKHMWLDCFVRSKVCTRDQGVNTWRNSSIIESIFSRKMNFACLYDNTNPCLNKQNNF